MESCSNQVLNKSKYILDFRFFKVATISLNDSFAHSCHSLNQLHEVVTWNAFQQVCLVKSEFVECLSFLMRLSQSVVL